MIFRTPSAHDVMSDFLFTIRRLGHNHIVIIKIVINGVRM
jgi:hypothetical protein